MTERLVSVNKVESSQAQAATHHAPIVHLLSCTHVYVKLAFTVHGFSLQGFIFYSVGCLKAGGSHLFLLKTFFFSIIGEG